MAWSSNGPPGRNLGRITANCRSATPDSPEVLGLYRKRADGTSLPEWQRRCPARFRYSDLNGAARVCGGRGQIMGFEWGSADPPWDREKSGMAVCGRGRVC